MLLLRLARHAVTISIKAGTVTRLATMQRRRTSRTRFGTILVVNIRLRRSLLSRLRGSLLSGGLSCRSLLNGSFLNRCLHCRLDSLLRCLLGGALRNRGNLPRTQGGIHACGLGGVCAG